jgi:hypothetical protein
MAIQVFGQTVVNVPASRIPSGSPFTQLQLGEIGVSEILPRLYALGWSGQIYSAANQAAQAVSVALATTYTGIGIYNPINSAKILVPLKVKYAVSVAAGAAATIGLIAAWAATGGVTAQTAKLTVQSGQIGNAASGTGIALSSATITTPTWVEQLVDATLPVTNYNPSPPAYLDGHISLLPGAFVGVGALTAITGLGSIFWAELPI